MSLLRRHGRRSSPWLRLFTLCIVALVLHQVCVGPLSFAGVVHPASLQSAAWQDVRQRIGFTSAAAVGTGAEGTYTVRQALQVLRLEPGATSAELRKAYRQEAKRCHPDTAEDNRDPREAAEAFVEAHSAYQALLKYGTGAPGLLPRQAMAGLAQEAQGPGVNDWDGRFTWELSAADVLALNDKALRATLWYSLGLGSQRFAWDWEATLPPKGASRTSLEKAVLPLLDEVVRRELLMEHAIAADDQAKVELLQEGRSLRHRVRDDWLAACLDAEQGGSESELAQTLGERFKTLTEARADITADEGSYPASWDQDENFVEELRRARQASALEDQVPLDGSSALAAFPTERSKSLTGFFRLATRTIARNAAASRAASAKSAQYSPEASLISA